MPEQYRPSVLGHGPAVLAAGSAVLSALAAAALAAAPSADAALGVGAIWLAGVALSGAGAWHLYRGLARALAAAERAKTEMELILGTISDGIIVLDPEWRVRYVNNPALRHLDRRREEMLGAPLWQLFPGLAESAFARHMRQAVHVRRDATFISSFPPLDACFEARCYPFEGGVTVCFRDVTAERDTEARLRQTQKLEALGQLTGGIAHDVNNLLTVMVGNLEMLALSAEERGAAGGPDLDLAQAGLRAGANASQLIRRLLAFSRRRPLLPQSVDVAALLRGLEPLLRRSVGDAVSLDIALSEGVWPALADPAELESAIINLALNARDAMPTGGRLTIAVSNVAVDRVYAALARLDRTGDFVMLAVADTGIGMTPEVLEKAFEPFFTTKQPDKGTGLGLAMVYGFAKRSGGHAIIDSGPGQGTIVRLYLPRAATSATLPHTAPAETTARGGNPLGPAGDSGTVRAHPGAGARWHSSSAPLVAGAGAR